MFEINSTGIISISRGDSACAPLFINIGTNLTPLRYIPEENDVIYFGVMEPNQLFEDAIIRKRFTWKDLNEEGDIILKFKPEDTEYLLPGKYYYQVQAEIYIDECECEVHTLTPKSLFWIME